MRSNPALKKLGLSDKDRALVIHTDDIGMCQATVTAFKALWQAKAISSGAAMVPCSWFNTAASLCREDATIDMGVHATLTSEWSSYRWGPLTGEAFQSGLVDEERRSRRRRPRGPARGGKGRIVSPDQPRTGQRYRADTY